jgi:hypothetical protein
MFNTDDWTHLIEKTYGYSACTFSDSKVSLYYSSILNEIADYIVAPPLGDFINIESERLAMLDQFAISKPNMPIKITICTDRTPELKCFTVEEAGYIHELEFSSYEDWHRNTIKSKFRNQITQGARSGLDVKISTELLDIFSFWEMHAKLRLSKFSEIPQPRRFFANLWELYISQGRGFLISAVDPDNILLAGIVVIIDSNTAYYKYAASYSASLSLRPNNYLVDRLIEYLDDLGIHRLNLGYTGSSSLYQGLRSYKLAMGAAESRRFELKTPSFFSIDWSKLAYIKQGVEKFIARSPSLEKIDEFSEKTYPYFV